jgi:hypothetical protein
MNETSHNYDDTAAEGLGPEVESLEDHLHRRFPEADDETVAEAIEDAAEATVDAKITSFRPLLVEHRAADDLRQQRHDKA